MPEQHGQNSHDRPADQAAPARFNGHWYFRPLILVDAMGHKKSYKRNITMARTAVDKLLHSSEAPDNRVDVLPFASLGVQIVPRRRLLSFQFLKRVSDEDLLERVDSGLPDTALGSLVVGSVAGVEILGNLHSNGRNGTSQVNLLVKSKFMRAEQDAGIVALRGGDANSANAKPDLPADLVRMHFAIGGGLLETDPAFCHTLETTLLSYMTPDLKLLFGKLPPRDSGPSSTSA